MSACLSVWPEKKTAKFARTKEIVYFMKVHIDATWQIRWIDLCGGYDAALCYHYFSNLMRDYAAGNDTSGAVCAS